VFSPTGENAVTNIVLGSRTKGDTDNWSLSLINKTDQVVRKFGGKGTPPAHLLWDGKDETGMPLSDGTYRYQLVVHDSEGREILSPTHTVEISTGGPQGSVPVIPIQP
jgi:flagellar hook assembly protein FlgD